MTRFDLPLSEAIAEQSHPDLPENPLVFAERLRLFPQGCWMLDVVLDPFGYAIAHPRFPCRPPSLNSLLWQLPADPDTFYVHDLALLQVARRGGLAADAVRSMVDAAQALALPTLSLVAVGASAAFWRHMGSVRLNNDAAVGKLTSYGAGVCAMVRRLR
jgi:hypothetical protein